MFKSRITVCAIAAIAASCAVASEPAVKVVNANDLPYEITPEGVAFAPLMGDRLEEAYLAMVKLPAGLVSSPHKKSATMFGVVISGEMTHGLVGADPSSLTILGPGAYYEIPADLAHVSRCVSETECVTVLYQDGAFDFVPTE